MEGEGNGDGSAHNRVREIALGQVRSLGCGRGAHQEGPARQGPVYLRGYAAGERAVKAIPAKPAAKT